jgi:hypothetical protein
LGECSGEILPSESSSVTLNPKYGEVIASHEAI